MNLLNLKQKTHLREQGWLHLPSVVPEAQLRKALRAINQSLGKGMNTDQLEFFQNRTFCPELTQSSVITDLLLQSPAKDIVENTIGEGFSFMSEEGQIALRFPVDRETPWPLHPHIDGFYSPKNGVEKGSISTFTGLLGVFLSDVTEDWAGNFTVWPGSHQLIGQHFKRTPASPDFMVQDVDLSQCEAVQIKARAGDVVLCHYELAHDAAANLSPWVRYAVYFRIRHREHPSFAHEALTNLWRGWDGMSTCFLTP